MYSNIILKVKHLKRYYPVKKGLIIPQKIGEVKAVDNMSFILERGKTYGIVGESGCGKTTLGRMLIGLDKPTDGSIEFISEKGEAVENYISQNKIQMVFQDPYASLNPRMNIFRIIEEPLRIQGKYTKKERVKIVEEVLEQVGLPKESLGKYPHEFSGGQRQRIGIARALVVNPDILVCDEPVSALDVSVQAQILNLLKDIQRKRKITYVFISHDISVVRYMSDFVIVMYLGQIMEMATKQEFFKTAFHPYSQALLDAVPSPNPLYEGKKERLSGNVPSPINMPIGCPFKNRCKLAEKKCSEIRPELINVLNSETHKCACLFSNGGILWKNTYYTD